MIIYTICIDPERGRYLAISTDDPAAYRVADSREAAVGMLVASAPGIKVDNVCDIEPRD